MSTPPPRLLAAASTLSLLAMLTAVLTVSSVPAASADPTSDEGPHKLLLLFDSSGSMQEPDADGSTKIDAARTAFNALIPRLPTEGRVGLRVYGSTVPGETDPGACTDSQLSVPIGPADKPALTKAVAGFTPYGETPISHSLQQAAKDLGTTGKRTILLVSDGEETCDPDPCATAKNIAGLGIDLKIDVVGFRVDATARHQLRCIADAGSGTFYETDDAANLAASLHRLSIRAFRPFRVSGQAVAGTGAVDDAPVLTAGQYVDTAPRRGEVKRYRMKRSTKGSTLHVGASARPAPGNAVASLALETTTVDGNVCGYGLGTAVSYERTNPIVTASTSSYDKSTAFDERCQKADEIVLTLRQSNSTGTTLDGVPIELAVIEEPPVTSREGLPGAANDRPSWVGPPSAPARPVVAGASFSDAPLVTAGRYQSSLFPGEVQFFKVRLGWGQRLEAAARAPKPSRKLAKLTDNPQLLDISIISPTRGKATAPLSEVAGQNQAVLDDTATAMARTTTVDVRYENRDGGSDAQRRLAVPGDYYVAVALGEDQDGETYLVPIEIVLGVTGRSGAGAPSYPDGAAMLVPGPDGEATEFTPDVAPVSTGADDDGPAAEGVGPAEDQAAPSAPKERMSPGRVAAVLALTGLVLVLVVLSGVRTLRLRRAAAQRHPAAP
ncbi:VWA domain-containing protein [Actinopolymorpha sp. B9G3]|uniref:VWA domain-containing protein n=1 Tax=Actinopolymorpha sp. B9G3 TaxID=3158970 RepID=UPI0032D91F18